METGHIKWFRDDRGYGVIQPDGGGEELWVHVSGIRGGYRVLTPGQRVSYTVMRSAAGLIASQVTTISDET